MGDLKIPLSQAVANPTLKDLLDALKQDILISTNCHGVATIQEVSKDSVNGLITVNATMNYSKTQFNRQTNGSYVAQLIDYPVMLDCPVIVLGGGPTALSFPIAKGDQCLILFNDRDLNNWFAGANSGPVATPRLHAFADAIALVGFQKLSSLDTTHAFLTNGTAKVGVQSSGTHVLIGNSSHTLNAVLQDLVTAVNNLVSAIGTAPIVAVTGAPGAPSPINPAITTLLSTVTSELSTVATNLGNLLE